MNKRNLIATLLLTMTMALSAMESQNTQGSQAAGAAQATNDSPVVTPGVTPPVRLKSKSPVFRRAMAAHTPNETEGKIVHPQGQVMVNAIPVHHNAQAVANSNTRNFGIAYSPSSHASDATLRSIDDDFDFLDLND